MLNKTTSTMNLLGRAAARLNTLQNRRYSGWLFVSAIIGGFESAIWAIFNNEVAGSGCGEQIDDILDGFVSAIIGGFESAVWAMLRVWSVVETAVGKWSAQPFVEEQK